jgi:flagellin
MFSVVTNTPSLTAARALYKNTFDLQRSVERMSTGLRVNHAGDDAASSAIADLMQTEIGGLGKAIQNAQDGISMAQTIDGGLVAVQENLQRIRELMVQGTNGTLGGDQKDSIQREINERITVIGDIANTVKFNGSALLKDSSANAALQTGAYNGETTTLYLLDTVAADQGIQINIAYERAAAASEYGSLVEGATAGFALDELHISGAAVASKDGDVTSGANGTLADMDALIGNISRMRGTVGAFSNALESKIEFMMLHKENVTASKGRMIDLDVAAESSKLVKSQILQKAATSMLAQANSMPASALDLLP